MDEQLKWHIIKKRNNIRTQQSLSYNDRFKYNL